MKTASLALFLLLVCALAAAAQHEGMPIPPGLRQAESPQNQIHYPPPEFGPQPVTKPQQLAKEADELNRLAGLVQKEIGMANQGQLPRDLPKNLKQIEKLAHRLRSQLGR
jgi:hypothetical protein